MLTVVRSTGHTQLLWVELGLFHLVDKMQTGPPVCVQSKALESQTDGKILKLNSLDLVYWYHPKVNCKIISSLQEHKHFQRKINLLQLWRDNGFPSIARPRSITAVELTLVMLNLYLTSLLCCGRILLWE